MAHAVFHRLAARADRLASRAAFLAAATFVADRHDLPLKSLTTPPTPAEQAAVALASRGLADPTAARVAAARHEAIYLTVTTLNRTGRSVSRAAGLHHEAVRKALKQIEDKRDDPKFDRALDDAHLALMGA
jgi:hypothetical protein